jgi:hypothetical protein
MKRSVHEQNGLLVVVEESEADATIAWKGVSDARFPGQFLNPLIRQWVQDFKNANVNVDLRALEYMNSATVMPLINLIRLLDGNGKTVRVLFSDIDWQRSHRSCMTAAARGMKNVQVEVVPIGKRIP